MIPKSGYRFSEKIMLKQTASIVCAGIVALDQVFQVERLPRIGEKISVNNFFVVNGGCAANAAVAVARLGGRALLAGPMGGPAGPDSYGDQVLAALGPEDVDCSAWAARGKDGSFPRRYRRAGRRDVAQERTPAQDAGTEHRGRGHARGGRRVSRRLCPRACGKTGPCSSRTVCHHGREFEMHAPR